MGLGTQLLVTKDHHHPKTALSEDKGPGNKALFIPTKGLLHPEQNPQAIRVYFSTSLRSTSYLGQISQVFSVLSGFILFD